MLLLCLPENKGGEDYTWISSLFMARSNPLQSLVWLSSGKSLRLWTAGMQPPRCGPGGEHVPGGYLPGQRWHCLWPPPEDRCHELGTAFCRHFLSFLPLLQEGKLRHRVIRRTHLEQRVGKRYVWVVRRKQGKRAGLWGPAEGCLGFNLLMLGFKGWADVAVKDSVVEMPHLLLVVQSHPTTCTTTCLAHTPNRSPPAVIRPMGKALNTSFRHHSGIPTEPCRSNWPQEGPKDPLKHLVQKSCPAPQTGSVCTSTQGGPAGLAHLSCSTQAPSLPSSCRRQAAVSRSPAKLSDALTTNSSQTHLATKELKALGRAVF